MRFAIKTLGCKVNQYEEQVIRENLLRFGFVESEVKDSDFFIVNSCTVTKQADAKTRHLIHKVKRESPRVKILVTGCCAALEEDIKILNLMPEIYKIIPLNEKMKLPLKLAQWCKITVNPKENEENISCFKGHTRTFLKMQDGCEQKCSYCKVSLIRSTVRSRDECDILKEMSALIASGYREIVLTGICLGAWKGSNGQNLSNFLRHADNLSGDFRIRLSSIEPNYIDEELIEVIASSCKICHHLHIPIQSGSDLVLKGMNRKYTEAQIQELIVSIRAKMPQAGLSMDVMVGFPGETENDFAKTEAFVKETEPSRLHIFKYSDRKGTEAYNFKNKVSASIARNRFDCLKKIDEMLQKKFCDKFVGKKVEVLIEKIKGTKSDEYIGYTREYVKAKLVNPFILNTDLLKTKVENVHPQNPYLFVKIPQSS